MPSIELRRHWLGLWRRAGAGGDPEPPYRDLVARYGEPGRAYHTLDHVAHCLSELAAVRERLAQPEAVEFALWFHDAVYDTHRHDNEERSAELAAGVARAAALPAKFAETVRRLILATRHAAPPAPGDEEYVVDIDLSILGQEGARFDEYERRIREEYAWVPAATFAKGRTAVLTSFLERPDIYSTPFFRGRYERAARANLSRSLRALRAVR